MKIRKRSRYISKESLELLAIWRDKYFDDPLGFARDVCQAEPTPKQIEMMMAVLNNDRVAVKSGNGIGKSFVISILALWFLSTRWESKVVLTSNTYSQLENTTFAELERVFNKSKLKKYNMFVMKDCEVRINSDHYRNVWNCVGLSPTEEERFQGLHCKEGLFFACDEASGDGLSEGIYKAITGSADSTTRLLFVGNPTRSYGVFFSLFNKRSKDYHKMTFTFRDRPDDPYRFEQKIINDYGKDSAEYKVRCLGEFVDDSERTVIPRELLDMAIKRNSRPRKMSDITFGVDFGRIKDNTVISIVQDNIEIERIVHSNRDQVDVANEIILLIRKYEFETTNISVRIDSTGTGDAIANILIRDSYINMVKDFVDIIPINFSYRAKNRGVYASITTEMFFEFKKLLRDNKVSIIDDEHTERLTEELLERRYGYSNDNKYLVESKKEFIKRSGKSPDVADALLLAYLDITGFGKAVIGDIDRY